MTLIAFGDLIDSNGELGKIEFERPKVDNLEASTDNGGGTTGVICLFVPQSKREFGAEDESVQVVTTTGLDEASLGPSLLLLLLVLLVVAVAETDADVELVKEEEEGEEEQATAGAAEEQEDEPPPPLLPPLAMEQRVAESLFSFFSLLMRTFFGW